MTNSRPDQTADVLRIDAAISALLAYLVKPTSAGGLKPDDAGIAADAALALDEAQLLTLIQDLARQRIIVPTAPSTTTSNEVDGAWTITAKQEELVRGALRLRIIETVQKTKERDNAARNRERQLLQQKRPEGRYTLLEASMQIAGQNQNAAQLLKSLLQSAADGSLPICNAGEKQRQSRDGVQDPHEHQEAFWDDLNAWLDQHQARFAYRFPAPNPSDPSGLGTASTTPAMREPIHEQQKTSDPNDLRESSPAQQRWPWQEEQIIRTTKSLGYIPLALPPDDRQKGFYVKSLIRARCAKNKSVEMRKTIFDKAWERMLVSNPPALKYKG